MGFASASAKKKPTLACIGRVAKVGEPKTTQSGVYKQIEIAIEGFGASRPIKTRFMFRSDWFKPDFNPETLLDFEGGKGLYFNYGKNIDQKGSVSTLKGLVGCDADAFDYLAGEIQKLPGIETEDGPKAEDVADVLRRVLLDEEKGARFGYILGQQSSRSGEDAEGNAIYTLEPYYEIKEFGDGGEKWRERQYKRAKKTTNGSFKVQFTEDDVPF